MKIVFNKLPDYSPTPQLLHLWLSSLFAHYNVQVGKLIFNFISEEEMLQMNIDFLNHHTHTDIITFPYNISPLEGEIFICSDRLSENAFKFSQTTEKELLRLISHGFLHLIGFNDKNDDEKMIMTKEENSCIQMFHVKHSANV